MALESRMFGVVRVDRERPLERLPRSFDVSCPHPGGGQTEPDFWVPRVQTCGSTECRG